MRHSEPMFRHGLPGGPYLRILEEADAEELVRVIAANRDYLAQWLPWVETTSNDVATRLEFIRGTRRQLASNDGFQTAIVDGEEIIGVIGFLGIDWKNRSTSLGYWLAEGRQGHGTMTEAVRALTSHAFRAWNLNRVEIRVAMSNVRSAAIPKRLGFGEEGVLRQSERHGETYRDVVVYAMLEQDWPSRA
jgi:ribosomal-protein-serine acetyltransferase